MSKVQPTYDLIPGQVEQHCAREALWRPELVGACEESGAAADDGGQEHGVQEVQGVDGVHVEDGVPLEGRPHVGGDPPLPRRLRHARPRELRPGK